MNSMSVKEIERAITELPRPDIAELAAWFEEFEARLATEDNGETAALAVEMKNWEAGSDEDLLNFEKNLAEIG